MSTLILGGGVTGLAAAWHLQRKGEPVEVWEAAASVGGWMKTLPWEGGHFETGPQGVLWQKGTAVDRLFSSIELPFKSPGTGARWVGKGGRLIPVPASPVGLMTSPLMSVGAKLRMMLEPFQPVRPAEPEEGLSAFIERRLGRGVATELLPSMIAGVLAAPAERKPSGLSDGEIATIRRHPALGASLIEGIGFLSGAREIVRYHHERYDGSGYPEGLSGEGIPLGARVFAVADVFDAFAYRNFHHFFGNMRGSYDRNACHFRRQVHDGCHARNPFNRRFFGIYRDRLQIMLQITAEYFITEFVTIGGSPDHSEYL